MKSTITPPMDNQERKLIKAWAYGYVTSLVGKDVLHEEYDEFCSYNEKWDINFYTYSHPNVVHVVAYPQSRDDNDNGNITADYSQWVEIADFDYNGKEIPLKETAE
jgi:hypothetical protein